MEKMIGTQEVANICQVAQGTVIRWIKEGKLLASSTAGGHNRIRRVDLLQLLKELRLPIPPEFINESKVRVLIIDDEPAMKAMIRCMLEENFENILIEEAAEGLMAGWQAHSFRPDLIILDLMLPGLDGFQVCKFIRQFPELKRTKIIAISGLHDPETKERILNLGADQFLTKPFDLSSLEEKIRGLLKQKGASIRP